ncbi:YciI family protein [Lysobacter yananisis]|uniref:YciI family protein n=1 Tax=Lysobacter yananisis TaxID=1003114 RepID=A0ABY9P6C1_9GAMM|nr:YciI family protein [Lysobacter yananisis]WMT02613.1 YciI family protein [Lysobacter yananisis]
MATKTMTAVACAVLALTGAATAAQAAAAAAAAKPAQPAPQAAATAYDPALAARTGADAQGMRKYVLVILKTGPNPMPDGEQRKAMFAGHFANMERLAKAGKLALAGPFGKDPDGWRGLFVLAVDDVEQARALVASDPAVAHGEFVAEYHRWYGSAATMLIPELHEKLQAPAAPAK